MSAAVADTTQATTTQASTTASTQAATTSAVSDPWFKDWVQADGSLNNKALERLPDHLKPLKETWSRQKTIDDIGVSTVHFQTLASQKGLAPLPADAPENVRQQRKALLDSANGVPKDPKEYGIAKPADLPDVAWNQSLADGFTQWAHKHSVAPSAVKELLNLNLDIVKGQLAQQAQGEDQFWKNEDKAFEAAITRDGVPKAKADDLVQKGFVALGLNLESPQTKNFMKGADARLMAMKHAIAIGEDKMVTGEGSGSGSASRDYAGMAQDIQRNPANPEYAVYRNVDGKFSRSQQESVIEKVNGYYKLAADQAAKGGKR